MKTSVRGNGFYTANKYFWEWPIEDQGCWNWLCNEPHLPQLIMEHVPKFDNVLMAGAHAGFYVKQYAQRFKTVYAIEPEPTNFYCLVNNVEDLNVIKLQLGLTDRLGESKIGTLYPDNSGSPNLGEIGEHCLTNTIDGIVGNTWIDLIHLDVEGQELAVLKGAVNTIHKSLPVIALETISPFPWQEAEDYLLSLRYEVAEKLPHDTIYVHMDSKK